MVTNNISIGQKIRTIRKRKGFTQAMLAEVIGRSPTYISYIESGFKSMSLETFVLIANALNATADEILEDSLENTVKVSNHEFASILMDCNDYEKKVLFDVATATKQALRDNRTFFKTHRK